MSSPNEKDAQTLLRLVIDARVNLVKKQQAMSMSKLKHQELVDAAMDFNTGRRVLRELEAELQVAIENEVKDQTK
jgi:hypothetical protein